jgi:hypothetical protein
LIHQEWQTAAKSAKTHDHEMQGARTSGVTRCTFVAAR